MSDGRQQPILLTGGHFMSISRLAPGRKWARDYVTFDYDTSFPASEYSIVTTASDSASPKVLVIGDLERQVYLPFIQFSAQTLIGVIPKTNHNLPSFWGRLNRASTYHLPLHRSGTVRIEPQGVLVSAV